MRSPRPESTRGTLNVTLAAHRFVMAERQGEEPLWQTMDRILDELIRLRQVVAKGPAAAPKPRREAARPDDLLPGLLPDPPAALRPRLFLRVEARGRDHRAPGRQFSRSRRAVACGDSTIGVSSNRVGVCAARLGDRGGDRGLQRADHRLRCPRRQHDGESLAGGDRREALFSKVATSGKPASRASLLTARRRTRPPRRYGARVAMWFMWQSSRPASRSCTTCEASR